MGASFQAIKNVYEHWGFTGAVSENKITSPSEFRELLGLVEESIPTIPCRVMPSSFDPKDPELRGIPYTLTPSWRSLECALRAFRSEGLIVRLPLFWQIEAPLHAACRAVGAYLFISEPENMPLGAAALRLAEADTIVTTPADAAAFCSYLAEHSIPPARAWILAHPAGDISALPAMLSDERVEVAQEIHLFPGIPAFEQCEEQRQSKKPLFHACEEFDAQHDGERVLLTSATNRHPLPFWRYETPGRFEVRRCGCGKPAFLPRP